MSRINDNPWAQFATFCQELAGVAGPLLNALGDTAAAVDRAQAINSGSLPSAHAVPQAQLPPVWEDEE